MKLFFLFISAVAFAQNPVSEASQLLKAGKFSEAHQLLQESLETTKSDPRLFTLDGFAQARLGAVAAGIVSYESALLLAPTYVPALEGLAEAKFKARAPDAAEAIGRLLAVQPSEPTAHAMLGTLAFERRDCATAEKEFGQSEQVIGRRPESLKARGACLLRLKNPASAVRTLSALPSLETDADALDLMADAREQCGETPEAIAALRKAIVLRPDDARLYLHFADIALAHHSFQAGVDMLNAGIERSPKSAPLYLGRGILRVQLAQYPGAEQDFAQAEAIDPASRYSAALQGMMKLQQNQLEPAADDIRQRIRKQPDDAFLHYLLAETLARRGAVPGTPDFAEALAAARKAVSLHARFALARDVLGRLYLQKGDTAAAVRESRLAFADDPTDQTALYHLIRALKKAGNDAEVPELTRRLAQLRTQAQQKEIEERRYSIVVGGAAPAPQ